MQSFESLPKQVTKLNKVKWKFGKYFCLTRLIELWNAFPEHVEETADLLSFKSSLDKAPDNAQPV